VCGGFLGQVESVLYDPVCYLASWLQYVLVSAKLATCGGERLFGELEMCDILLTKNRHSATELTFQSKINGYSIVFQRNE